ncbi:protein suppressor of hairy wing-like isoform X1 [Glossina fuscipes]|uniref:Protein suppressor of hairy wing-like isoform X1 n=2 Tax=Glossina fuscipes TaxID=7396 RepID=A0A9C5Z8C8_9MUSC|nr:protein suppressor of hairy wing-like isoform X1 [Glossina fuscipes]
MNLPKSLLCVTEILSLKFNSHFPMSIKEEKKASPSSNMAVGVKILNDKKKKVPSLQLPFMTSVPSVPLSPPKQITLSIAKPKKPVSKEKKMDHYLMQTIKGEKNAEGVEGPETIDFILTDNNEDDDGSGGITKPSGEITEELRLTDEEEHDGVQGGNEKTEEIVEHVCGKCFKTFRRLRGLKKHLDYCRFDSGYHLRKAEMLKNLEKIEKDAVIMENKDVCFCCGESYDTYHLGHINCPDCPKSFKTQMSYERHIFITHSELNDHPCSICNAKLRSGNLLILHEEQHKNRGKPYACKICGKDFTRSYHLHRHQKYSSCSANENDSMKCKVCDKAFYRLDNLRAHLKQHLGTHVTKKPEYMCPICKNCFYSLSTLNIHTRTHTGERPFDCDLCEKKFPSLVALKKHRRYHTGEKPYTCSVCKQSFAVKEVLNRHMKRHTGERPYVCNECGKSFIQGVQLRNHSKTHLRPYECNKCPEKFKTEKQLQRHFRDHQVLSKRRGRSKYPHRCETCKVSFKTESEYTQHMKKGSHLTPAQKRKIKNRTDCAVCKKNFDSVQSLQFHILKVHQEDPENFVNEDPFQRPTVSNESKQWERENDEVPPPAPKIIKIESNDDIPHTEIIRIVDTSIPNLVSSNLKTFNDKQPIIKADEGTIASSDKVQILQEFVIHDQPTTSSVVSANTGQTIILSNEAFTVIPLESDGGIIEPITTHTLPNSVIVPASIKKSQKKSLAESLAAAIADNDELTTFAEEDEELSEDDYKLKDNVYKLLDMLVDNVTLKKFGWPETTEEKVLCKVIENCGHDLSKDPYNYQEWDYGTRMREYVKLLFTVVIHNDSIKQLLNNYPIDEVIEYVLGNDDDDEDDDDDDDENDDNTNENKEEKKTDKSANSSKQINKTDNNKTVKSEKEKLKN